MKDLTVYLNSGSWYVLDISYLDFIDNSFKQFVSKGREKIDALYETHDLNRLFLTEADYNNSFLNNESPIESVINADGILLSYVEICDQITFDDVHTYLVCNKKEFSGIAKDLLNQITASAFLIHYHPQKIEEFYDKLVKRQRLPSVFEKDMFVVKIKNAKYISSYMSTQ